MRGDVLGRINVAGELRAAIRSGGLGIDYQPIVDLATGEVVAMEALARWTRGGPAGPARRVHPRRGGDRPDRRARRGGAARVGRAGDELAAAPRGRRPGERQPARAAQQQLLRRGDDHAGGDRAARPAARPGDHRVDLRRRRQGDPGHPDPAARRRRLPADRRLRHRLQLAELPAAVPRGRRAQDRPLLPRRGHPRRGRRTGGGRARPGLRAAGLRRGRGDPEQQPG